MKKERKKERKQEKKYKNKNKNKNKVGCEQSESDYQIDAHTKKQTLRDMRDMRLCDTQTDCSCT